MSVPTIPNIGDWFCFPKEVVSVGGRSPVRPWIVAGSGAIHPRPPVVPRTTRPWYGGVAHSPHHIPGGIPSCGIPDCAIDEPGWIGAEFRGKFYEQVDLTQFTEDRESCHEPDDEVIERVMEIVNRAFKAEKTRKRRGR